MEDYTDFGDGAKLWVMSQSSAEISSKFESFTSLARQRRSRGPSDSWHRSKPIRHLRKCEELEGSWLVGVI